MRSRKPLNRLPSLCRLTFVGVIALFDAFKAPIAISATRQSATSTFAEIYWSELQLNIDTQILDRQNNRISFEVVDSKHYFVEFVRGWDMPLSNSSHNEISGAFQENNEYLPKHIMRVAELNSLIEITEEHSNFSIVIKIDPSKSTCDANIKYVINDKSDYLLMHDFGEGRPARIMPPIVQKPVCKIGGDSIS